MRRNNDYLGASGQKSDPAIRSGDIDVLWDGYISTIRLLHLLKIMAPVLNIAFIHAILGDNLLSFLNSKQTATIDKCYLNTRKC